MDADYLRERLNRLIAATPEVDVTVGAFVGDKAGERRVADNLAAGRIHFRTARRRALFGLETLEKGDIEFAELLLRDAEGLRAAAIEAQLSHSQFAALMQDAKPRGKAAKAERDRQLAAAVAGKERLGLKGKAARLAALAADPELQAAFAGLGDPAIRAAINRGKV